VRRGGLVDAGRAHRALERALERLVEQVMAPPRAGPRIAAQSGLRKHPEPRPRLAGVRILARKRLRRLDAQAAVGAIALAK
jgi:hypothetical protein